MSRTSPPRWLEAVLLWSLPPRSRETISGDLLEEYRDQKLPSLGATGANLWYLRQTASLLCTRSFGGPASRTALAWVSVFTILAGLWLALMEQVLRHSGYAQRTSISVFIAVQGLATVILLMAGRQSKLFALVLIGAMALGALAVSAMVGTMRGAHFEGFVLVIGSGLLLQAVLTGGIFLKGLLKSR